MAALSIRVRLTFWYSLVLLAGLVLFGAGIWIVVSHELMSSLDETLAAQSRGVATVLQSAPDPVELREELDEYIRATPGGNLIEIHNPKGDPLLSSTVLSQNSAGQAGRFRIRDTTVLVNGAPFQVRVAIPLDATESTLRRVKALFLWTVPAVLLVASLGGYWISRRALASVDTITTAARSIGIGNLSQRLIVPATGDELQRLSETWNDMLVRLESAVNRLSQFTADASHELRTPIALIRTTAELALRRERTPETYREALRQVVIESERTSRLIEDLLLLARADAGLPPLPLERIELTPLVQEVCRQGKVLADARALEISAELPDHPVFADANDPELRRLLLLLLDNAVKYTPTGGCITISLASDAAGASLAVRDNGIGIPESDLSHVFERFYRVDESRNRDAGGAGLGLSIAKWIADRQHAILEAESVVGQGSTFRIRFRAS